MRLLPLSSSFTRKVNVASESLAATVFALLVFISAAYFITGEAWAQSLPGGSNGADVIACSPAPCVLPPTQATQGQYFFDAPVVADPANPAHLIVGSEVVTCFQGGLGFQVTTDAGSTWDQTCMAPMVYDGNEYLPDSGPILGYDRNGNAYIAGFYAYDGSGNPEAGFQAFQKYTPGGGWSAPAVAVIDKGEPFDPWSCWLSVDTSAASPYVDSVYISCVLVGPLPNGGEAQVVVSHSNDGGGNWKQVAVTPLQRSPESDGDTAMAVGNDGTVYLTCVYSDSEAFGPAYMVFSKSSDGGNTWSKPKLVAPVTLIYPVPNSDRALYIPNTPAIAVDNSDGPHAGSLYVVMYNWTGTFMQVQVARSTDGGDTWSKPVPVAPGITHDQFFPWIAVSPTGLVGVSWLDRRNDPANVSYQAFAAISADGQSFQPNVQLTTAFSNPNNIQSTEIGDYTGDTWDGANYFIAAWMDDSNGQYMEDYVGGIRLK
jgi:hypothetical protein